MGLRDAAGAVQRAQQAGQILNYYFAGFDQLIDPAAENGIRSTSRSPARRRAGRRQALRSARRWYKPNATEFGKFAAIAAEHFKGRVDRYSIWNEPN